MASESNLEKRVCTQARKLGIYTRKFTSPGNVAVPDRIFIYQKRVLFIEFKAPGKKPTEMQQSEIEQLMMQGVPASWTSTFLEAVTWLVMLKQNRSYELMNAISEKNFWQDPI